MHVGEQLFDRKGLLEKGVRVVTWWFVAGGHEDDRDGVALVP